MRALPGNEQTKPLKSSVQVDFALCLIERRTSPDQPLDLQTEECLPIDRAQQLCTELNSLVWKGSPQLLLCSLHNVTSDDKLFRTEWFAPENLFLETHQPEIASLLSSVFSCTSMKVSEDDQLVELLQEGFSFSFVQWRNKSSAWKKVKNFCASHFLSNTEKYENNFRKLESDFQSSHHPVPFRLVSWLTLNWRLWTLFNAAQQESEQKFEHRLGLDQPWNSVFYLTKFGMAPPNIGLVLPPWPTQNTISGEGWTSPTLDRCYLWDISGFYPTREFHASCNGQCVTAGSERFHFWHLEWGPNITPHS